MLRHLLGLLAGIALAPVLWVGLAWSSETFPRIVEGDVGFATVSSVVVLCLLGGLGAYLVASRRSPMVAASSGVLLSALCLWPVLSRESLDSALSWLNDASFLYPNGTGLVVALPLGVLLAGSAFLPTRWRAADDLGPLPGTRVVASANRDRYRSAPMEEADGAGPEVSDGGPWNDGGPVGDTVPDVPPPASPRRGLDDPNKTTTPFRRGGSGAVWTPLDDDSEHTRILDDDRR
ncbi:YIP1 family protein [Nocardiopsis alba]|uniref:YIP1 family protein n=1 Tax=Nocardiopsis alba TaxID=53437 RepID=UPI0033B85902